jgi:hypothetical protein
MAAEVSTSAVYAYWHAFDLDNRRPKLDEVRRLSPAQPLIPQLSPQQCLCTASADPGPVGRGSAVSGNCKLC